MSKPIDQRAASARAYANPFREIRQLRGMSPGQVAEAMGVELRTYYNLETSTGRASLSYVDDFARVTNSDAKALALALVMRLPLLAVRCADNKLATLVLAGLEDLHQDLGEALAHLEAAVVMSVIDEAFGKLAAHARRETPALAADALDPEELWLTARQIECLEWVQAGKSSSVIGQILGLSGRTIDHHIANACRRLKVSTRTQAVAVARDLGLLAPASP
jgi:DNA-binding CsgD family transcriptional regulator/DNA-binding XRE family transcriptional regulator